MPSEADLQTKYFQAAMTAQAQLTTVNNAMASQPSTLKIDQWDSFLASMSAVSVRPTYISFEIINTHL